MTTTI